MELTKTDKKQLTDIIRQGILRRCEEWLKETANIINKDYGEENAFDRCMKVTKRSKDYFKEAMSREEKNHQLYLKQRDMLDMFLDHGAITREQHDKSLHDLTVKMGEAE